MLISYNELKKYVDLKDITPEIVAEKLTSAGIEVEGINKISNATNLVIGEIKECVEHPDSDHLHICKVDVGNEVLQIVCGAPNARTGLKVIVALDGAQLPGGTIKKGVIRGVESNGMLCSLVELGVEQKYLKDNQIKGIEEVSSNIKVGERDVLQIFGLDDVILDLNLLANRSDAYSIYNVAKEVAALCHRKVTIPEFKPSGEKNFDFVVGSKTDSCKLFAAKIFKNVQIKESPKWLQDLLRNEGIRSINNIVDIGNYVMLLTGQPLNMYDLDKLEKSELIVKDDYVGDVIAMDDNNYKIQKGDIVITSNNKVVCIAGVMTSKEAVVDFNTKNICVEAANFYGPQIRRTTTRIGLTSDSSQRFVKGINPNQTSEVMNLVNELLNQFSSYDFVSKNIIFDELNYEQKEIECSFEYINNRLGTNLSNEEIINALNSLYFKTKKVTSKDFIVEVPDSRIDINERADLSEEVFRFIGVDTVNAKLPEMVTTVGGKNILKRKEDVIAEYLLNQGLYRVLTYTLINKEDNESFNILNNNDGYVIFNPNTEDHKYVRKNLLSSILRCGQYNYNHQNKNFGIFEISQINDLKETTYHLSIMLCGNKYSQDLINSTSYNFYDVKGYVEEILDILNIQTNRVKYERISDSTELHPTRNCKIIIDGKVVGVIGDIYPTLKKKYDFKNESIILCEINLSSLFDIKSSNIHFNEINKFPFVSRDYAFVVNKEVKYSDIKNDLKHSSSLISDVHIFDIYSGEHLEKNKVSIAIKITIEAKDHTLTDEELKEVDTRVRDVISSKFSGVIRN